MVDELQCLRFLVSRKTLANMCYESTGCYRYVRLEDDVCMNGLPPFVVEPANDCRFQHCLMRCERVLYFAWINIEATADDHVV